MKKELITFDQLAVLSFLKFVKLDSIDMTLLMKGIKDIADVEIKDDSRDYFVLADGSVLLENSYIKKINNNVDRELFENMSGSKVMRYLDTIDMFEFVLRKIKFMGEGCVIKAALSDNFSNLQIRFMNLLYQERYIMDYLHQDMYDGECPAVKLTKRGMLYLYMIDHKEEVDNFANLLTINGYDKNLIELFLITQDLDKKTSEILILDNFLLVCDEYNINPCVSNLRKVKAI